MTTQSNNDAGLSARFRQAFENSLIWLFAIATTLGLTLILALDLLIGGAGQYQEGSRAPDAVVAPRSEIFESDVLTDRAIADAVANVEDVYSTSDISDIGRAQSQLAREIFAFVDIVRADAFSNQATSIRYLQAIEPIQIEEQVAVELLNLSDGDYEAAKADVLNIIQDVMREPIRESQLSRSRQTARRSASFELSPAQEAVVTSIAPQLIVPNSFFDPVATDIRREEVAAAVPTQRQRVDEGDVIVSAGEIIDAEAAEIMRRMQLVQTTEGYPAFLGSAFLAALLSALLLALYWEQFRSTRQDTGRYLAILAIAFLFFSLGAKLLTPIAGFWAFLFPGAALSMLVVTIYNTRMAVTVTLVLAGLVGYVSNGSMELAAFTAVGGLFAILALRENSDRVNPVFRGGLLAAIGYIVVILIFRLPQGIEPVDLAVLATFSLLNGVISASLTLAAFFAVGGLFGVITTLQLQELSRLDHPMLKELLRKAPGTYHHSIMVANLAEQAAERIQANGTLVRVGAFYHDIGKTTRPPFFTENQDGENPHDQLEPEGSARIIINHVADGLELAQRYRLPDRIRDFIAEHHGDRVVWGFYMKAREKARDPEEVDVDRYRYRGPRPRSRETGIVMLADSVEATSSAVRPSTEAGIEKLVDKIVDDHVSEGQLDDSGLTLGDIKELRVSFIETLKGRFHVRVRYRGNEELVEADEQAVAAQSIVEASGEQAAAEAVIEEDRQAALAAEEAVPEQAHRTLPPPGGAATASDDKTEEGTPPASDAAEAEPSASAPSVEEPA